jgi:cyclophilin family peptidyl-prolyl cis-trans isomerase/HEAT repeat protein
VPATYSLARLHPAGAATDLLLLSRDPNPAIYGNAVRALTRAFADSARLSRESVVATVAGLLGDSDPLVRIAALRSLETFRDSTRVGDVIPLVQDPDGNVEVQALEVLGTMNDPRAAVVLRETAQSKRPWALRRQALLSLARVDTASIRSVAAPWQASPDWRDRATAGAALAVATRGSAAGPFLSDRDGRVVAATLQAWSDAVDGPDGALLTAARAHLGDADAAVRSVAADAVARAPRASDLPPLISAWRQAQRDSFPDAGESALGAIEKLSESADGAPAIRFAQTEPVPASFRSLYQAWAEAHWDLLSGRWGPSVPLDPGRSLEDYRSIVRRYILGTPDQQSPHVFVEVDGKGTIELALYGADAPMTVANFLRLVDAGYFNGDRWHRVVPAFVVQDGDPRGDGWGGPGGVIRDELNRHRYHDGTVGMALSGPDTGGSQWFITLGPEPHLDGGYTAFGEVASGGATLHRILQGDLIRSIHR